MKKIISLLALLFVVLSGIFAQQLNYQAVVRDAHQQLVVNTPVKATFVVNFACGKTYNTTLTGTTSAFGLISINFGDDTLLQHDWAGATLSVTLKNAANESVVYVNEENRPVNAVPYALTVSDEYIQRYLDEHHYMNYDRTSIAMVDTFLQLRARIYDIHRNSISRDSLISLRIDTLNARMDSLRDSIADNRMVIIDTASRLKAEILMKDTLLQNNVDTTSAHLRALLDSELEELTSLMKQLDKAEHNFNSAICTKSAPTDYDGNTYKTVQIGKQCWMAENLRTTKYADGTLISEGSTTSITDGYWYYPNGSASNKDTYGLMYNWKAVMRNSASSAANPSGVQGICPTGWHVPSNAEWTQLTDYVSSQSEYQCDGASTNIAKALASTTGWSSSSTTCAIGNNQSGNNATGFSATPVGCYNGSYVAFGSVAYFWGATQINSNNAYYFTLRYGYADVSTFTNTKSSVFSVRCLRD